MVQFFLKFPVLGRLEPWVVPEHPNQFPLISGNSFGFSSRFLAKCGHIQITCICNQLKWIEPKIRIYRCLEMTPRDLPKWEVNLQFYVLDFQRVTWTFLLFCILVNPATAIKPILYMLAKRNYRLYSLIATKKWALVPVKLEDIVEPLIYWKLRGN